MKVNDIVLVVGDESLPTSFIGRYGRVTTVNYDLPKVKVWVEFNASIWEHGRAGLEHTAYPSDLKVVGRMNDEKE